MKRFCPFEVIADRAAKYSVLVSPDEASIGLQHDDVRRDVRIPHQAAPMLCSEVENMNDCAKMMKMLYSRDPRGRILYARCSLSV